MVKNEEIEQFLAQYDQSIFDYGMRLRELILDNLPSVIEQLDVSAKMIGYSYGYRYEDTVCVILPSKKGLKLGFFKGVELPDPHSVLKGTAKLSRYVEIDLKVELKTKIIQTLLKEAYKANRKRLNV